MSGSYQGSSPVSNVHFLDLYRIKSRCRFDKIFDVNDITPVKLLLNLLFIKENLFNFQLNNNELISCKFYLVKF